ncbi:MAG: amidohydrolase family protein [Bacteroidetes bacterium]|nr:amidohydrolase family protein [Bacteroidota bacterium]
MKSFFILLLVLGLFNEANYAQMPDAAPRSEGKGPYDKLIIRGVNLIVGNGAPTQGLVDIVIEKDRITSIRTIAYPGTPIDENRRPKADEKTKVIEAAGMYVMPGLVDMHGHTGGEEQGTTPDYVYKLWLAHGITTVREPGSFNGLDWTLRHKEKSLKNEIDAPRIFAYVGFGLGAEKRITTPEEARKWVQMVAKKGADGLKLFGMRSDIYEATIKEARKLGLRVTAHHAQLNVTAANVLTTARWGMTSMEHWYGLPEAMFEDKVIQDYPHDYNYNDEQNRFEEAGKLWKQTTERGSEKWDSTIEELIKLDFTIDPTFTIYEASRDLMKERTAEWHPMYTLPTLWEFYRPNRNSHGSFWFDWGTAQEIAWKKNYQKWMSFINDYKNAGGRVTTGSDAGYIYKLYGFGLIRELELLQEAGFHPLEVVQAATKNGAEALGQLDQFGTVEVGKKADLLIVEENPLANFKVLYGTGHIKVTENNDVVRVGGVKWTIKDGIVYDAKDLLKQVAEMVKIEKDKSGFELKQPGME